MAQDSILNILTFNCKGFNSCFNNIIEELQHNSDIIFLCEHWLQPFEIPRTYQALHQKDLLPFLKSSVDAEEVLVGRPYGGVGFVCRRSRNLYYSNIEIDNDRISVLKVTQRGSSKTLLYIIGVYLPYFNGCVDQITLYAETLDKLQSIIDDCADAPVMMMGDMNVNLPRHHTLPRNWHRSHPFNRHSYLLHDFLYGNNMCIANFEFDQSVNYTYELGDSRSYIDHVLVPSHLIEDVIDCRIANDSEEWSSDHLPIRIKFRLPAVSIASLDHQANISAPRFPRVNWDSPLVKQEYVKLINDSLCDTRVQSLLDKQDRVINTEDAQNFVDEQCDHIIQVMHDACGVINDLEKSKRQSKPRKVPWWSNNCTLARDRTRFWRNLWLMNDKRRDTYVFTVYKHTKKLYRNVRRMAVNSFHRSSFDLISNLFKSGNCKQFWNKVRASKLSSNKFHDDINIQTLTEFFSNKFSCDNGCNSMVISNAEQQVTSKFNEMKGQVFGTCFSKESVLKYIKKLKAGKAPGYDGITPEHLKYSIDTNVPLLLSEIFNTCVSYGVIPNSFKIGILLPLLKKSNLDSTQPGNFRPIILSSVISKLLEYAILSDVTSYTFCDLQYGFVEGCSTQMAICNVNDIIRFFNAQGPPVYACSLDAEGL